MIEYVDINKIKPAPYNPRKITEAQIEELTKSIKELGFIIPILVNKKNNIIIAGHQRTRTAKERVGLTRVPVMYVDSVQLGDEIKFNQIHNAVDKSLNNAQTLLKEYPKGEYLEISNKYFSVTDALATVVKEICKLILKYGNVLSAVICRGKVIYGCEYVKACQLLNLKVNAYICKDDKFDTLLHFLNEEYGQYSYDGIKRDTYVQGLAQMFRSTEKGERKRANSSSLYEHMVLPYLHSRKDVKTILDFGCGKGAYINSLKKKYRALGVEFYNNNRKSINVGMGHRMIDELIKFLQDEKKFDVVVCDSVLNSVDSVEAEKSVVTFLNLMAKKKLFISGRLLSRVDALLDLKKDTSGSLNYLQYLDEHNFTANYREGKWYFQKFHSKEQATELLERCGFKVLKYETNKSSSFQIEAEKVRDLSKEEYISAIDFEFNLPLPNGKSYHRNEDVKNVLGL